MRTFEITTDTNYDKYQPYVLVAVKDANGNVIKELKYKVHLFNGMLDVERIIDRYKGEIFENTEREPDKIPQLIVKSVEKEIKSVIDITEKEKNELAVQMLQQLKNIIPEEYAVDYEITTGIYNKLAEFSEKTDSEKKLIQMYEIRLDTLYALSEESKEKLIEAFKAVCREFAAV